MHRNGVSLPIVISFSYWFKSIESIVWFTFEPPITLRWLRKLRNKFSLVVQSDVSEWEIANENHTQGSILMRNYFEYFLITFGFAFTCSICEFLSVGKIFRSRIVLDAGNCADSNVPVSNVKEIYRSQGTLTNFDAHTDCFTKVHVGFCFFGSWFAGSKFDVQLHPASILSIFSMNEISQVRLTVLSHSLWLISV